MKIYNTSSKLIEEFRSPNKIVGLYTCGPTVYDAAHIGNLRTYIFEDVLIRALNYAGFHTKQVMNITDVDDKTIKKSGGVRAEHKKITKEYEKMFYEDLDALNILTPNIITRATEYIKEMVVLVEDLLGKGYAYKSDDGSVYFSIEKFSDYGKLSGLDKTGLKSGARVMQDEYDKANPADFVLWKAWDEQDGEIFWESAFGKGRPGWHIECSAMAEAEIGETIDIHAGGVDLIFPHHENEIAQSEAHTGKQFARFWIHGEHLLVDGKKMSKSLGNYFTLADIRERGFDPLDFRYLCLQAHYRSKLNFTWEGMEGASHARHRLKNIVRQMSNVKCQMSKSIQNSKYLNEFKEKLFDDLNTPEALAVVWEMARDEKIENDEKIAILQELDEKILGLGLFEVLDNIPEEIIKMLDQRTQAKKERDYQLADQIRNEVEARGYKIEDSATETKAVKI